MLTPNAVIVRVRSTPGGEDAHGDPLPPTTVRTTLGEGWGYAPRTSSDITERARQGIIVGVTLYGPHGADIDRLNDSFEIDGDPYVIDGEVAQWKSPLSSWPAGCEIALKRAEG